MSPGKETSEFGVMKSGSAWSAVGLVLGFAISIGSAIAASQGEGSVVGIIVGAVVAVAAIAQDTLVRLGYIKSRTAVKTGKEVTK